jgi:hypothetical protein
LTRVFLNVFANALDATGGDTELTVTTADVALGGVPGVEIRLNNTGSFIPPADRERVFELFFTKNKAAGTGFGLAISREIVEKHKGRMRCESSHERGTAFIIWLPASAEAADERAPADVVVAPATGEGAWVAVLDDDPFIREAWSLIVDDASVLGFASPEAFFAAVAARPDVLAKLALVVTDFYFGSESAEDGSFVLRKLHAMRPDLPVVVSSDAVVGDLGFSAAIGKEPRRLKELWAAVSAGRRG